METVSFDACGRLGPGEPPGRHRLILRRQPPAGLLEPYDLAPQVEAMRAVHGVVAVPRLLWFVDADEPLGAPFYVMDFVDGDVPLPVAAADGGPRIADVDERVSLARDLAANLARLHSLDWRRAALPSQTPPTDLADAARRQIALWRGYIERAAAPPMPILSRALRELERSVPSADGPVVLVHGDFRTGNFIRSAGRVRALLDWEMVHLGDPMEDLAWAASRLWRGQTDLAGFLVAREDLYAFYQQAGGMPVDPDRVRFYDILAAVKMTAIMLTGVRAFADGRTEDLRMAIFQHQLAALGVILAESLGMVPSLSQ